MSSVWNTAENLLLGPSIGSGRGRGGGRLMEVSAAAAAVATHNVGVVASTRDDVLGLMTAAPSDVTTVIQPVTAHTGGVPGRSSPANTTAGSAKVFVDKGRGRGSSLPPAIAERLARHKAQEQLVYRRKLKHLKRIIKDLVFENAALCDQVAEVQQQVVVAAEERIFLLKRLLHHQTATDTPTSLPANTTAAANAKGNNYFVLGSGSVDNWDSKKPKVTSVKRKTLDPTQGSSSSTPSPGGSSSSEKGRSRKSGSSSKPKRLCPPITLDSAGRPIFPITLGPLTIHSLGEIISDRDSYHTEHCIFPVGFCSSRMFASLRDPLRPVLYTCKIVDGGLSPRFEVVCEDEEEETVVTGGSPSECHNQILTTINLILDMDLLAIRPEGSDSEERGCRFFGLTHPSVQNVLQACPGARKCSRYKWVKFEVCRSEAEVESVFEAEKEASLCHEALLRNIRFARHHVTSP